MSIAFLQSVSCYEIASLTITLMCVLNIGIELHMCFCACTGCFGEESCESIQRVS